MDNSNKYLNPQTLAKLQGLQLRARRVVEGYVAGLHRSPMRGFSIEFAEHREYSPGDDLRYVDWKVFGRTDKFYLKQYEDETNLVCYLVLDISESMCFQSDPDGLSKLEYAQCMAASLAWLILQQRDAVGLVTFDSEVRTIVRPSTSPQHISQLLHVMENVVSQQKTATGAVLHELANALPRRGVVILFSDLFDEASSILKGLKHLAHRRHDVNVVQVLDAAEIDFPFQQTTKFKGLEGLSDVLVDPRGLRRAYLREFRRFTAELKSGCHQQRTRFHSVRNDAALDVSLSNFLTKNVAAGDVSKTNG